MGTAILLLSLGLHGIVSHLLGCALHPLWGVWINPSNPARWSGVSKAQIGHWYDRSRFHLKFNFPKKKMISLTLWIFGILRSRCFHRFLTLKLADSDLHRVHLPSPAENLKIFNEWPWPWITYYICCICCICKDMYTYYIRFNYISIIYVLCYDIPLRRPWVISMFHAFGKVHGIGIRWILDVSDSL